MFDDVQDIPINPSPRPPRQRIKNQVAGVKGGQQRRLAKAKVAPALPSYAPGIDPNFADRISARRPYLGPRHFP